MLSGAVVAATGLEGAWRAARGLPPGPLAARLEGLVLLIVAVTSAGGLGILVGGARPSEALHFVYAVVALGIMPLATSFSRDATARRKGIATFLGAFVGVIVILRLFATA